MHIATFTQKACCDTRQVGGKAAGLAEMTLADLPVAPGFAVTASAYRDFLDLSGIGEDVDAILATTDLSDTDATRQAAAALSKRLENEPLPEIVSASIRAAYLELCTELGVQNTAVAIRSSATAEDSVDASFAGEFETWVDVSGVTDVLEHVRGCYASVFSDRVLLYLGEKSIDPRDIEMAVVVQKMVRAQSAGVMFTISPVTGDRSTIVIEASWGLGLTVVGGEVTPDRFSIDKIGLEITEKNMGDKAVEYRQGDNLTPVPDDRRSVFCLGDDEIIAIAQLGKKLERLHGGAQDIEFAVDEELPAGSRLVLLQCRPETIWSNVRRKPAFDATKSVASWVTNTMGGDAASKKGNLS